MKEGPKKNFYCGDEVDYDDKCLEQCDRCVDATGVDYGYLPEDSKQNIIDMMKGDEELGLYDEIQPEQIWNEEKKKGIKEFIDKHKQECMITKIMQMDAEMAYDSLPKQETLSGFEEGHKANLDWLEQNSNQVKQETLGEAATKLLWKKYPYHPPRDSGYWQDMFIEGAKWQQERSYSEEDIKESWYNGMKSDNGFFGSFEEWFEQFKKK